jgi:type IV secretory pathway VirB3-like protein
MTDLVPDPAAVVAEVQRNRWVRLPSGRGDLMLGTPAALTRTGVRAAAGGALVSYTAVALILHTLGFVLVGQVMLEVLAVPFLVGVLAWAYRDQRAARVLRERDRRARIAAGDPGRGDDAAEAECGDAEPPRGRQYGPAWWAQRALPHEKLPVVPDYRPISRT